VPCQVTPVIPPGSPPGGARNSAASKKLLPAKWLVGSVVVHCPGVPGVKVVLAMVAEGSYVIAASGAFIV